LFQISWAKSIWDYLIDGFYPRDGLKKHSGCRVFIKKLAAPTARHQDIVVLVNTIKRNKTATTGSKKLTNQRAFGT
jgi:hypothetical protein